MLLKHGHHLGKVDQRAAETVDLVDDHHVDPAGLYVRQQCLKRRPFHIAARVTAVVVMRWQALPGVARLPEHVRFTSLALGVEGIEVGVQPFAGRLATVDGAANCHRRGHVPSSYDHASPPYWPSRKKR
jgi:hypothetical protein